MAGDWIKIEHSTPEKPEVFAIAEQLVLDPDHVTGALIRLWIWADQQLIDGNARGVTKMAIDRKTGVTGFADALISVGWLVFDSNKVTFINFSRHNGKSAKKRAVTNRRVAEYRSKVTPDTKTSNAGHVTESVTREEKSREEDNPPTPRGGNKRKAPNYSEAFLQAITEYTKRQGSNPIPDAWKAWSARLKEGEDHAVILDGVRRYAAWARATGKEHTEYVMQAKTFFGPSKRYMEAWDVPSAVAPGQGDMSANRHAAEQAKKRFHQNRVIDGDDHV